MLALVMCWGCGGGSSSDDGGGDDDPADPPDPPRAECTPPVQLVDTSQPDRVVGDGSPASCTAAAVTAAVAAGGKITFSCGAAPHTIALTAPLRTTVETVIDGGGLVTLSGSNQTRILELDSGFDQDTPRLTVQRLTFRDGRSPAGGNDTAVGGGAIYRDGGSLVVIDSTFLNNRAPLEGQDVAGGAIYGFGGKDIIVVGSVFSGNQASNGGAIGGLQSDLIVINSAFSNNDSTGNGGNPGNGGCGGALYQDGKAERTNLCGVQLTDNDAGSIGGALFRVSNTTDGTFAMDRTTVRGNAVADADTSNAGGLYLQGLAISITASTVAENRARYGGGIWIGQDSTVAMENVTVAGNDAFFSHGGGLWLNGAPTGKMVNCTIANNRTSSSEGLAAAMFGEAPGLTLQNTIIAGQETANPGRTPGCDRPHADGKGNLEFPIRNSRCAPGIAELDAKLGALGDHGGPTPTLVPQAGSPAIGMATSGCPATDQRGEPRGATCTSGAVEVK